jgi:hypothetical protein
MRGSAAPTGREPNVAESVPSSFPSQGDATGVVKAVSRILAEACQGEERREMIVFSEKRQENGVDRMARSEGGPVGRGVGETLFCKDFDCRSQRPLAGACLDSVVT